MPSNVVSLRQINRSYLARQLLLERQSMSPEKAISHLIGLQAQDVMPPYIGLWSRLQNFDKDDVHNGLIEKKFVRATTLRKTVHLMTRQDILGIMPKTQIECLKYARSPASIGGLLTQIQEDELIAWGHTILANGNVGGEELREFARRDWPDHDPQLVASAIQAMLPLVQVPPRGLWKTNARARWSLAEIWLSDDFDHEYDDDSLIRRYIAAYGPIGVGDFQAWSRLTGTKAAMARVRPELTELQDESGRQLLDLPLAPWPDEDMHAPVRLLGAFDNLWLSHRNRERVLDERHRLKIINNGIGRPTVLIDGFVAGRYKLSVRKQLASLSYEQFRPWSDGERSEFVEEASRLLEFLEPGLDHAIENVESTLA